MGGNGSGRPKAELLKLDGTQIDHMGKVTQTDFFKFLELPAEHNANLEKIMTPEQALKFRNHVVRMKVGTSAMMPMLCFLPDELITMDDYTQKPIKDVKIGDYVITSSGSAQKVTKLYERQYSGNVIRFGTNKNSLVRTGWSTPNHEYLVRNVNFSKAKPGKSLGDFIKCEVCSAVLSNTRTYTRHLKNHQDSDHLKLLKQQDREVDLSYDWIPAENIKIGQYIKSPITDTRQIHITNPNLLENQGEALSIVIGYYLAEGSLRVDYVDKNGNFAGDHIQFTFHILEEEYSKELQKALVTLGYNPKEYFYREKNTRVIRVHDKEFPKYIEKICGKYSYDKKIINEIFYWPINNQKTILRCYLNGDGCYKEDSCESKTVSRNLAWQLYYLALNIGMAPSIPSKHEEDIKRDYYSIYYSKRDLDLLLRDETYKLYSTDKILERSGLWRKIALVEEMEYNGLVYNLEVENCHSYTINGFTVHNCGGPKCPVKQCPFMDKQNWPIGSSCPIEATLIAAWTKSYMEDIGVQPEERTEMILINKLVECDMIDYRANIGLSKDSDGWTLIKTDLMTTKDGGEQEVSSLHPLLEAKTKAHSERMKVLESFSVTRKEKAKKAAMLKQREEGSIGDHWADIKAALNTAKKIQQVNPLQEIKKDAEFIASNDFIQADWEEG